MTRRLQSGIVETLAVLGAEIDDPELYDAEMLDRLLRSNTDAESPSAMAIAAVRSRTGFASST
jgi:hypothetical protein